MFTEELAVGKGRQQGTEEPAASAGQLPGVMEMDKLNARRLCTCMLDTLEKARTRAVSTTLVSAVSTIQVGKTSWKTRQIKHSQHREGGDRAMEETLPNPQRGKDMRPLWSISNRICITTGKKPCEGDRILAEDGVQRKWALPGWIRL